MTTRAFSPDSPSVLALAAAVICAATDGAYLAAIHAQGATPANGSVVPFVAAYVAAIASLAILGVVLTRGRRRGRAAAGVLVTAAVASGALGFLAIFSVGIGLLVGACLLAVAAAGVTKRDSASVPWVPTSLGAATALGVLIGGFTLTGAFWGH